ncbi:hypothetical protein WOLCODRAFT_155304 [Wolfiporia cocos MD-104 SS10]|uniref:Uncharacterized protein n=1 Tax=Wolfiporia cocos (strain MD-104) TaxID=742152 RepID=A0A2H3IXF3_WOLCO|nr:hypothetical protein WOLCODRAFT_155304 [Wolfiporia cocos MD-104 SS10]
MRPAPDNASGVSRPYAVIANTFIQRARKRPDTSLPCVVLTLQVPSLSSSAWLSVTLPRMRHNVRALDGQKSAASMHPIALADCFRAYSAAGSAAEPRRINGRRPKPCRFRIAGMSPVSRLPPRTAAVSSSRHAGDQRLLTTGLGCSGSGRGSHAAYLGAPHAGHSWHACEAPHGPGGSGSAAATGSADGPVASRRCGRQAQRAWLLCVWPPQRARAVPARAADGLDRLRGLDRGRASQSRAGIRRTGPGQLQPWPLGRRGGQSVHPPTGRLRLAVNWLVDGAPLRRASGLESAGGGQRYSGRPRAVSSQTRYDLFRLYKSDRKLSGADGYPTGGGSTVWEAGKECILQIGCRCDGRRVRTKVYWTQCGRRARTNPPVTAALHPIGPRSAQQRPIPSGETVLAFRARLAATCSSTASVGAARASALHQLPADLGDWRARSNSASGDTTPHVILAKQRSSSAHASATRGPRRLSRQRCAERVDAGKAHPTSYHDARGMGERCRTPSFDHARLRRGLPEALLLLAAGDDGRAERAGRRLRELAHVRACFCAAVRVLQATADARVSPPAIAMWHARQNAPSHPLLRGYARLQLSTTPKSGRGQPGAHAAQSGWVPEGLRARGTPSPRTDSSSAQLLPPFQGQPRGTPRGPWSGRGWNCAADTPHRVAPAASANAPAAAPRGTIRNTLPNTAARNRASASGNSGRCGAVAPPPSPPGRSRAKAQRRRTRAPRARNAPQRCDERRRRRGSRPAHPATSTGARASAPPSFAACTPNRVHNRVADDATPERSSSNNDRPTTEHARATGALQRDSNVGRPMGRGQSLPRTPEQGGPEV